MVFPFLLWCTTLSFIFLQFYQISKMTTNRTNKLNFSQFSKISLRTYNEKYMIHAWDISIIKNWLNFVQLSENLTEKCWKLWCLFFGHRVNCFARFSTELFDREYGRKTAFLSIWSGDVENKPVDKAVPQTEACLDTREQVSRWISIHRSRFHECSIQLNVTSVSAAPRNRLKRIVQQRFLETIRYSNKTWVSSPSISFNFTISFF